MFGNEEEIEQDFMDYGKDDEPKQQKKETNFLGKMIQFLSVIVLLGVVGFMGMFGYKYMQKNDLHKSSDTAKANVNSDEKKVSKSEVLPKTTVQKASDTVQNKQKMYTQEEMQAIVKMLMEKMQTSKQKQPEQAKEAIASTSTKDENKVTANKDLVNALNNVEVDQIDDIDEDIATHANQDDIYKQTSKKDDKKIDRYNKVVVKTSKNSYDDLANLSLEIGSVVDNMKSKDKQQSTYTSSIKKEVSTRVKEMRVIIVKKGDSLSKIAKRAYGSAQAYDRIMEANPDLIKNPNHIYIGQRLRVPDYNN